MNRQTMNYMRKMLGWLCLAITPASVIFSFLGNNAADTWHSISATYYATDCAIMIGLLVTTAVFFASYRGYNLADRIITDISAVSALGVVVFPCWSIAAPERTGLLQLERGLSHTIHCASAMILFASFFVMIFFQFTKTSGRMTEAKRIRNKIYRICGIVIAAGMLSQVVTSVLGIGWMTIVNEGFMLTAFSIAWLVKGEQVKTLRD